MIAHDHLFVESGVRIHEVWIAIPKFGNPFLASIPLDGLPVAGDGDQHFAGDHLLTDMVPLSQALMWSGAQMWSVRQLAEEMLVPIEDKA